MTDIDGKIDALLTVRRMRLVFRSQSQPFTRLLELGGLDDDCLNGEVLEDLDLRNCDFTKYDLSETRFINCKIDDTTVFAEEYTPRIE